jgi:Tfp pilus assembly protein PilF
MQPGNNMSLSLAAHEFNAGNFRKAEQLCLQCLAASPSDPEAMNLMAALSGQAGRHDLAAEWSRKAIEIRPRDAYYHRNHITALLSMDRVDYATQAVEAALRLLPGNPDMLTLRGVVRARQNDLDGAVKSLEAALEINPNLALAHYNLSEVLRRQGAGDKSLEHLKKSLELDPHNPDAVNNMAGVLLDKGEFIESLRYLQRYLQLAPRSAQAYCNLSVAMSAAGDVHQSLVCLSNALKIDPSLKDPRFKMINLLTSTGEFDEAERMLDDWEADVRTDQARRSAVIACSRDRSHAT